MNNQIQLRAVDLNGRRYKITSGQLPIEVVHIDVVDGTIVVKGKGEHTFKTGDRITIEFEVEEPE